MSLEDLRQDIDGIDARIIHLLDRRAGTARRIAAEKIRRGLPLRDAAREEDVLRRLPGRSNGDMPAAALTNIYRQIMAETLSLEGEPAPAPSGAAAAGCMRGKSDVEAEVLENSEIAAGYRRMRLRVGALAHAFQPGQFFQLLISGRGGTPFLRRPFAPSELTGDGFVFVYAVVGSGTASMAALPAGSRVRVLAPLGKGYTPAEKGSAVVLVGGGCGGPSLGPLAKALTLSGVRTTVILGARSAAALLGRDQLADQCGRLVVATDDGSAGAAGTAVQALEDHLRHLSGVAGIYACGPLPMLKATALLAEKHNIPCEVSLEERMACGFGACVGCAVETRDGLGGVMYRRVCHDGPVFDSRDLVWNRLPAGGARS